MGGSHKFDVSRVFTLRRPAALKTHVGSSTGCDVYIAQNSPLQFIEPSLIREKGTDLSLRFAELSAERQNHLAQHRSGSSGVEIPIYVP